MTEIYAILVKNSKSNHNGAPINEDRRLGLALFDLKKDHQQALNENLTGLLQGSDELIAYGRKKIQTARDGVPAIDDELSGLLKRYGGTPVYYWSDDKGYVAVQVKYEQAIVEGYFDGRRADISGLQPHEIIDYITTNNDKMQ